MKKSFVALALLFSFAAQAAPTPIQGANLFCSYQDTLFAIDFHSKHVWLGRPGEPDGIPLRNVTMQADRCPFCYRITGKISDVSYMIKVYGQTTRQADVTATGPDADGKGSETTDLGHFNCTKSNTK